ncbi:TetR/AcrR family transcriptional regulator [Polymorphum gilvum]|uniref:TetR family transcriptional regulator n=1 Tax=Polymorphum gilvum (strain LMG 25793 / CGMCC 1.9160 / SL003B-26A1) TaxID=991905 RepID=F2J0G1_POLGS|nr:TetR/AcrR family transcriptional regulator [Polymorphum gilvum]ADZ69629.1 TetR family transcriptional regulator [Polymorphum gilvum SL003B-26A1]
MATEKTRQKILTVFLDLLEEHPWQDVSLPLVAKTAGVKLSVLRDCFSSKTDMIAAFAAGIDKAVLDATGEDMADQPARDRLFDVLMTRLDMLEPRKRVLRRLKDAALQDPALALEFNAIAVRSHGWMLAAAAIDMPGLKGRLTAQGLALAFARVVEVWLDEDDAGLPKTMARLDRELDRGETWVGRLSGLEKLATPLWQAVAGGRRRRRAGRDEADDHAVAAE